MGTRSSRRCWARGGSCEGDDELNRCIIKVNRMAAKIVNFLSYCMAFVFYGSLITSMGPIIPFFSQITGHSETYYSFIFFCRAVGYIFGGSLVKYLIEWFRLHTILFGASLIGGICFAISTFSLDFWNLTITIFLGAACCCIINVTCNICTMQLYKGEGQDYWVQLLHTMFGVGGLIGPFIVAFLGAKTYFTLGVCLGISSFAYLIIDSPEMRPASRTTQIAKVISRKVEIMICVLFLLYIGQEVGYGSWVSSYAVMEGVSNAKEAAFAGEVFWITNTVFRIVLIYVTIKVSTRLKILMIGMIVGCVINYIAAMTNHAWFAAFIGSFLNGMFLASMFALFLTLPVEFGYLLSKKNTANFMMCASLGEGALAMPIGYLMGVFGPSFLYLTELLFAVLSYYLVIKVIEEFNKDEKSTYLTPKQEEFYSDEGTEKNLPYA